MQQNAFSFYMVICVMAGIFLIVTPMKSLYILG